MEIFWYRKDQHINFIYVSLIGHIERAAIDFHANKIKENLSLRRGKRENKLRSNVMKSGESGLWGGGGGRLREEGMIEIIEQAIVRMNGSILFVCYSARKSVFKQSLDEIQK